MSGWSLKLKVGLYCTLLTVLGMVGTAAFILPLVYQRQLGVLDESLRDNAKELFDDLNGKGLTTSSRPISPKAIPLSLIRRYIVVENDQGAERFRTRVTVFKDVNVHAGEGDAFTMRVGEHDARFVKVEYGNQRIWVGTKLGALESAQQELRTSFSYVIPVVTLVVFIGAMFIAKHALRPVTAMTLAAERISAQSPDERLPAPTAADEIARLTNVLNQSFDRLQRAYSAAARFSADASHQLKTPIAVLRAGLEELRMCDYLQAQDSETVDTLLQQTRRLTTLVEDLLLLAQADAGRLKLEPTPLNLATILAGVLDDTEALGLEKELIITLHAPPELFARADARRVKIILQNLTENAVKYNHPGGKIRIDARREGSWALVSVANTGGTISEQHRERLFERFNRAGMGENIKGHGLGLNIARELARAHGGDLALERSENGWTEFVVRLPLYDPPVVVAEPELEPAMA